MPIGPNTVAGMLLKQCKVNVLGGRSRNIRVMTQRLNLARRDPSGPQFRMLQGIHETFAQTLGTALSAFLQSEIRCDLGDISVEALGEFQQSLSAPACFVTMRLRPRPENMVLHLDSLTVLALLELLLGGKGDSTPASARALTEIEWSLLEEIVRVLVRPLGEAWRICHNVEFEVESLGSDPTLLDCPDPGQLTARIGFRIQVGSYAGDFEIAVPETFFQAPAPAAQPEVATEPVPPGDLENKLGLIEDAFVEFEVKLQGPSLRFKELMELKPGQVLTFDYSLEKPVNAVLNDAVTMPGHIVSSGKKRAFQVERLP
jgi:flagellar motor switch protein FliM